MDILVTGARGFVGKNLVAALRNIRDNKDRTHPKLDIQEIYEYDTDGSQEQLAAYARSADFVFHLAGVNRPKTAEEYLPGNTGSLEALLTALLKAGNRCPVMLASSAQASRTKASSRSAVSPRRPWLTWQPLCTKPDSACTASSRCSRAMLSAPPDTAAAKCSGFPAANGVSSASASQNARTHCKMPEKSSCFISV